MGAFGLRLEIVVRLAASASRRSEHQKITKSRRWRPNTPESGDRSPAVI